MLKIITPTALSLLSLTAFSHADIRIQFDEGAPKDRFTISNLSGCDLASGTIMIDLSKSSAGLIFDTTGRGAGVEVYQPLEITQGKDMLVNTPSVSDGDNSIELAFNSFANGDAISFTIDVDDTIGQREITVSNAEISGAAFSMTSGRQNISGSFDETSSARASQKLC